jgi:phenylacetate-coenzyme A ligase PaaK-like adenylate-forming protein
MVPEETLAALLARARQVPFYRDRATGLGISDTTVDAAAFNRLPLTRRSELLEDQLAHLPHGTRHRAGAPPPVRAGITGSGTQLLVLLWSAADLVRERAAGVRVLRRLGVTAGMRIANTLPGALHTPGSLLLGDVVEEIGGLDIPLGVIENEAAAKHAWELCDRVEPTILVLDPATAGRFLAAAPAAARPWWQGIIWVRAPGGTAAVPAVSDHLGFGGWRRAWLAVPEAACFVAHECGAGNFHVDDSVYAEVVDDRTGTLSPGDTGGMLALTPLDSDAALLRYASGARARRVPASCSCGTPGVVIDLLT